MEPQSTDSKCMSPAARSDWRRALRSEFFVFLRLVWDGVRSQAKPGFLLLLFELVLLFLFYYAPVTKPAFKWVADLKTQWGFGFAALSTSLFCGLVPFAYLAATKQVPRRLLLPNLAFYVLFYAEHGIEVEAVYHLQGVMWGTHTTLRVTVIKTCFDQFVITLVWFLWKQSLVFLWRDCAFNFRRLKASLTRRFFMVQVPAVQASSWMVWIPSAAVIYAMPAQLQLPMNNLVGCFWTLLLGVLARKRNPSQQQTTVEEMRAVPLPEMPETEPYDLERAYERLDRTHAHSYASGRPRSSSF
eukprot:m51a1_g721 hypothetical protein (300) ;mRNA; f:452980-454063